MRRRTFDALLTTGGLILAIVLLVAGGLMTWAHSFVNTQVSTQLSSQQIFFPPKGEALASPQIKPYLTQYAGQQLTTGQQAQAYADHFIAVHIAEMSGGKTYAQLSTESMAAPNNTKLAGLVNTVFKGETLRGLLLNSYAFWKMGQIALYGAIAAYIAAALMLILSLLGFAHLRRVPEEQEVLAPRAHGKPATA